MRLQRRSCGAKLLIVSRGRELEFLAYENRQIRERQKKRILNLYAETSCVRETFRTTFTTFFGMANIPLNINFTLFFKNRSFPKKNKKRFLDPSTFCLLENFGAGLFQN
jgi:hypothetical protein